MGRVTFTTTFEDGESKSITATIVDNINDDLFIHRRLGKVIGHLGTGMGDIRIIKNIDWEIANDPDEGYNEQQKVDYLIKNSKIVTIDDNQIQDMMQQIHALTKKTEYQIYIILTKEGLVKAVRGADGIDQESIIESFNYNDDKLKEHPIVEVRGGNEILLGQVHTHNLIRKENNKTSASSKFGGETVKNDFGPSKKDEKAALNTKIIVYNIDSWNHSSTKAQVTIGRIKPNKKPESSIAKTKGGKGKENKKHLDIGKEALNYRIFRYNNKLVRE